MKTMVVIIQNSVFRTHIQEPYDLVTLNPNVKTLKRKI